MDTLSLVIAGSILLVVIYIGAQLVMKPVKLLGKVLVNSIIGLILLMLVNYGGTYIDFQLPINIITILVAGFLGIPGILLMICFQILLH